MAYVVIFNDYGNRLFITRMLLGSCDNSQYLGLRNFFPGKEYQLKVYAQTGCNIPYYNQHFLNREPESAYIKLVDYDVRASDIAGLIKKEDSLNLNMYDAVIVVNGVLSKMYYIRYGYNPDFHQGHIVIEKQTNDKHICNIYYISKHATEGVLFDPVNTEVEE